MALQLSEAVRADIRARRARGQSIAAIAAALGVSAGVVHKTCAAKQKAPKKGRAAKAGPPAPTAGPHAAAPPALRLRAGPPSPPRSGELGDPPPLPDADVAAELAELVDAEGGDADLGMLSLQIARCDGYRLQLAGAGNYTGVVQVERLIADLVERRRKLRPPPPPDPEEIALVRMRERDALIERIELLVRAAEAEVPQADARAAAP